MQPILSFLILFSISIGAKSSYYMPIDKLEFLKDTQKLTTENSYKILKNGESEEFFLDTIVKVLNSSILNYNREFYIKRNNCPNLFFIWDLTDTLNKTSLRNSKFRFEENHVYHFAPINSSYSISFIAISHNGSLKIFKGLNCSQGEHIENVIEYLEGISFHLDMNSKDRISNYRQYCDIVKTDVHSTVNCINFKLE